MSTELNTSESLLPADSEIGVSCGDGSSGFLLFVGGAFKSDSAIVGLIVAPVFSSESTQRQSYMLKTWPSINRAAL